jgi:hypothetical protein
MGILTTTMLSAAVAAAPAWSLSWSPRIDAERDAAGQPVSTKRQTTELGWRYAADDRAVFMHEFRDLDLPAVDGVAADANGYVHRLTLAWQKRTDSLRLQLGAAVSVSSNALKSPDDLGARDLQPAIGVSWRVGPAWLAIFADDRLGRTLIYPGFEWPLHPAPAHELRLGFPVTSWHWQIAPRWRAVAAIEPDGSCWRVRDGQTDERTSDVCVRSWQAVGTLRWQASERVAVEAGAGYNFPSKVEYQLQDGRFVDVDLSSGGFVVMSIGARF